MALFTPSQTPQKCAVIGGGVAGLAAAQSLAVQGVQATVFDAGMRGVGGLIATRRFDGLSFDSGAQFFTARSPAFRRQVEEWQAAGVVQEWQGRHAYISQDGAVELLTTSSSSSSRRDGSGFCGSLAGLPLYVGTPTNNALCQHMAQQLGEQSGVVDVHAGCLVQSATRSGGGCGGEAMQWQLKGSRRGRGAAETPTDQQELLGCFDAVILADTMPLMPGSAGHISGIQELSTSLAQLAQSVHSAGSQPCFALMAAFHQPLPGAPFDSATIQTGFSEDVNTSATGTSNSSSSHSSSSSAAAFQWVACNSSKPGRPALSDGTPQCWVALTSPQHAQQLLERHPLFKDGKLVPQTEEYRQAVARDLLQDFRAFMQPFVEGPLPDPSYCHAQRWGRAFVAKPLGTDFLMLPAQRLALCGAVAAGSSVEAAWSSGRAAGQAVGAMLAAASDMAKA